ncbi:hypothetical protein pb186bvf_008470 [Paramecium bursaria]
MEERIIQFPQFLAARGAEIAQMQNNLQSKFLNTTKHPYQVLHKHMRRRAMSHNRYRIPSRLRKQMHVQALITSENAQKISKCRKHIRKHKLFVFWNRSRQVEWFETHIYQAKRMKMVNYYGFKVAEKANEKNFRSVHRQVDHGCVLFDASYHYIVNGLVNDGLQVDGCTIIHPSLIKESDFEVQKNKYSIFQIIGGNSLEVINRFLSLYGYSYDGTRTFYISILNYKEKIQSLPTYDKPKIKSFDDYNDQMEMKILFNNQGDEDIEKKIWQKQNKEIFAKRFKVTNRSRYTHKRKRKLEYQKILKDQVRAKQQPPKEKEIVDESLQKKAMRWLLNLEQDNDMVIEENPPEIKQQEKLLDNTINLNILIIPQSQILKHSIDLGYKIIINMGNGLKIWRQFNQLLKIKAIGLRDIKQLCLENNILFEEEKQQDLYEIFLRSNKRPNYKALQFPYPFQSNWNLFKDYSLCTLKAYGSIPHERAIIFQPTNEDLELLNKGINRIEVNVLDIKMPKIHNRIELLKYERELEQIVLDRKLLGFVVHGNFSLKFGQGLGQGKIDSKYKGQKFIVLFRNHYSKYYFFADCETNA